MRYSVVKQPAHLFTPARGQVMRAIAKSFKILAPGNSLQRRTAYSLALVRLILAPVILLAIYYLFRMGWIVDRIVNVDAPASALAQQASIEKLLNPWHFTASNLRKRSWRWTGPDNPRPIASRTWSAIMNAI